MTLAARIGDLTQHGGVVSGPGAVNVLIGGQAAAVAGDLHTCPLAWGVVPHGVTPFARGSATVHIAGRPALRAGDLAGCGAPIIAGLPNVKIGG